MKQFYRIVAGENGNNQGHIISCNATTVAGALRILRRELARYGRDGWGRVEYNSIPGGWCSLGE